MGSLSHGLQCLFVVEQLCSLSHLELSIERFPLDGLELEPLSLQLQPLLVSEAPNPGMYGAAPVCILISLSGAGFTPKLARLSFHEDWK